MTSRDFCYWLQGHFEISKCERMDKTQLAMVKRHLTLVFKHEIDPSYGEDPKTMQAIHDEPSGGEPLIRC